MPYEWDPAKDLLSRRKHGLSLAEAIPALEDSERETWMDDRFDYREDRVITMGRNLSKVLVVVSTEIAQAGDGEEIIRIISVRKANRHETNWFYHGRS